METKNKKRGNYVVEVSDSKGVLYRIGHMSKQRAFSEARHIAKERWDFTVKVSHVKV